MQWIAKIEGFKGPAARRTALSSALQAIQQHHLREQLFLEASRIEVDAALSKADALKTPAAKRRRLQAALDELLWDPVPDELQAKQLEWLRTAITQCDPQPEVQA